MNQTILLEIRPLKWHVHRAGPRFYEAQGGVTSLPLSLFSSPPISLTP